MGSPSPGDRDGLRREETENELIGRDGNVDNCIGGGPKEERAESSESSADEGVDVVARRLEELRLRAEEPPDVSEEQLRMNDQSQEDELLALKAIYGDNTYDLDRQSDLRTFQIHIHIEAPAELVISSKLNSSSDLKDKKSVSNEFSYSFKVQYLPPLVLTCILPKSYPSHLPPLFTISVQWLDTVRISHICSMLDSIWLEQSGHEILYPWVEWLHSSSLPFLGFDEEIVLGPYNVRKKGDRRAISASVSASVDIPALMNYNERRCHEDFCKSLHSCIICFSEYTGMEFVKLPCQHLFCQKCMKSYSEMHVKEGTVNKLSCPNPKCGAMIPPGLLKTLLGDEEFERWESLMLQKSLQSMSDIVHCPRCEMVCIEDADQHAQCSKCFFSFCTLCRERRHVGQECTTPELRLQILKERQNSPLLKDEQKRKELDAINYIISVKEILKTSRQCPSCKIAISRTMGCNKMVCSNCGQFFCYRCGQAIRGYDHFSQGPCDLITQEMIREWEDRQEMDRQEVGRQELGRLLAENFTNRRVSCPNCAQYNSKLDNNNHIFCWSCQIHFCYLCKKIIRRGMSHFGPKGCKQHTDG